MQIKKEREEEYRKLTENQDNDYGIIIRYAERWADLLEYTIKKTGDAETAIKENAETLSHMADTEGLAGFGYGYAGQILSRFWEYGEYLKKWHNGEAETGL